MILCNIFFVVILKMFINNCKARDFFKGNALYEDIFRVNSVYKYPDLFFSRNNMEGEFFLNLSKRNPEVEEKPQVCGIVPNECSNNIYRSYDGSCNNLKNPSWGTPNSQYNRILPAIYADGIKVPPLSKSGKSLPLARSVSLHLYPDVPITDHKYTLNLMQYGQIITHDLSMSQGSTQTQHYKTKCCSTNGQLLERVNVPAQCYPLIIPYDDPAHSNDNTRCMSFDRTVTNRDRNCATKNSTAEQLTSVNHYLDLSFVYGNDDETNHQLREFRGGRLRAEYRKGRQWPPRAMNASAACRLIKPKDACYFAGDTRINQNPQLALLHVVFLREHNRIADVISRINPQWDDELVFQESRKINIGQHQHITYYEWLPYIIGKDNSLKAKLIWNTKGFVDDYNENVDATVLNEYSTGAIRHFHSLIVGSLHLISEKRYSEINVRFSDVLRRPQILEEENGLDNLIRGLTTQLQSASDQFHDSEVTQFLFKNDNETFGIDLKAFDIQRSRDHGLASYNDYREVWKLPRAKRFQDFLDFINPENVQILAKLYESPDDVDLIVGGSLERNIPSALVGPTFLGIIVEQYFRTRVGDRFWFENSGPNGFTLQQLNEIRKSSISRLLCDNGHNIINMQPRSFERLSSRNPLLPCVSLQSVDLSIWRNDGHLIPNLEYSSVEQNVFFLNK